MKSLFIAATGQNVGKTTICLGLVAALKKLTPKVGFMKPVGQQFVSTDTGSTVDKDVFLFKDVFDLKSDDRDMSPVLIPPGFTRRYLDGELKIEEMKQAILSSYNKIASDNTITIVEGTGHTGVGSIIDLSNAEVASLLGTEAILIASGGLGSSFDDLALNVALLQAKNVPIRGVILNKVKKEKREMILNYFPKALKKWGVPLLGCIPFNEFLNSPTMEDFSLLFETPLLSGYTHGLRHFNNLRLVAGSLEDYMATFEPNQLVITPASRDKLIFAILKKHAEGDFKTGLVLTGRHPPEMSTLAAIKESDLPVIYAPICSYDAMRMITSFTAKIRREDESKVKKAIEIVEKEIKLEMLCPQKLL